jgi:hypothetical protein
MTVIKLGAMRWAENVARVGKIGNAYRMWFVNRKGRANFGDPGVK